MSLKWELSPLGGLYHAVDNTAEHPSGVYRTECGHMLVAYTTLRDVPLRNPCGACGECIHTQPAAPPPARQPGRRTASADDGLVHLLPDDAPADGSVKARCGHRVLAVITDLLKPAGVPCDACQAIFFIDHNASWRGR
jgi:hypothetical protein